MPINGISSADEESDDLNDKKYNLVSGESANASSPGATSINAGAAPANPSATNTSSGSFTNLQSYLDANKDQSAGLGAKIADNVNNTANQGRTQLSDTSNQFNTDIDNAGIDRSKLSTDYLTNTVNNSYNNPNSTSDQDIQNFADIRDKNTAFSTGTDSAPKALTDESNYATAQGTLQNATDKANLTNSEAGRQTLLKGGTYTDPTTGTVSNIDAVYNSPNYTNGEASLDQLFTQNAPENKSRFEDLRANLTGTGTNSLATQQANALQAATDKRTQMTSDLAAANQDEQDLFYNPNGLTGTFTGNQYIDPRLAVLNPTAPTTGQTDQDGNTYTPTQVNQYGILNDQDTAAGALAAQLKAAQTINYNNALAQANSQSASQGAQQTLGADLSSAVTKADTSDPTLSNALTPAMYARLQALNALSGRASGTVGTSIIPGLDATQYDPSASFDKQAASTAIGARADKFKLDLGNALSFENSTVPGYGYGAIPASQAASDIVTRMLDTTYKPDADNPQAQKVIDTFTNAANSTNQVRATYGLPPLDVNNFYNGGSQQDAVLDLISKVTYGHGNDNTIPDSNLVAMRPYAQDILNLVQQGQIVQGLTPAMIQSIQYAAQIQALQNLMQADQMQLNNPTQAAPTAQQAPGTRLVPINKNI